MPFYLQILKGPTPSKAQPVVVVSDPLIISRVITELSKRLTEPDPGEVTAEDIEKLTDGSSEAAQRMHRHD